MQPTYPAESEQYREKITAFLDEYLPSTWTGIGALDPERWRRNLATYARFAMVDRLARFEEVVDARFL